MEYICNSCTKYKILFQEQAWLELTRAGKEAASALGCSRNGAYAKNAPIRELLEQIPPSMVKDFFEEAIRCYENSCYRAAVILAWESALGVMYDLVLTHHLSEFNSEAARRNSKWKDAKSFDDLSNMKESTFLDILSAISVIGKSTKQELQSCLTLRNGCGHPNTCLVGPQRTLGYLESLWSNVYKRFLGS